MARIYGWYGRDGDWVFLDQLSPSDLDEAEKFARDPVCEFINGVTRDGVLEQIGIIRDVRAMGLSFR